MPGIPQQPVLVNEYLGKHVLEDVFKLSLLIHKNIRLRNDVLEHFSAVAVVILYPDACGQDGRKFESCHIDIVKTQLSDNQVVVFVLLDAWVFFG